MLTLKKFYLTHFLNKKQIRDLLEFLSVILAINILIIIGVKNGLFFLESGVLYRDVPVYKFADSLKSGDDSVEQEFIPKMPGLTRIDIRLAYAGNIEDDHAQALLTLSDDEGNILSEHIVTGDNFENWRYFSIDARGLQCGHKYVIKMQQQSQNLTPDGDFATSWAPFVYEADEILSKDKTFPQENLTSYYNHAVRNYHWDIHYVYGRTVYLYMLFIDIIVFSVYILGSIFLKHMALQKKKQCLNSDIKTITNAILISNCLVASYLIYVVYVWFLELVDFVCYFFQWPQATPISRIMVASFTMLLVFFCKRKKAFIVGRLSFNWKLLLAIVFFILLSATKIVYPDTSADTFNYHLLAQQPGFVNYFKQGFGAGGFQVWGFRLGDRLYYPFRVLLGYRLGTVLNTIVVIIIYLQLVLIMQTFTKDNVRKFCLSPEMFALLLLATQWDTLLMMGIYYVDILSIPLILEAFRILASHENEKINTTKIIYLSFLLGFAFAFKMTNIAFVLPLGMVLLVKSWKKITPVSFIVAGLACVLPVSIYLIFNFVCTRNPVFPYYNKIFRSPYFKIANFKDNRWGGSDTKQQLLWFYHIVKHPESRVSEINNPNTTFILFSLFAFILLLSLVVYYHWRKRYTYKSFFTYIGMIIFSYLIWTFSTGYPRYYIGGFILWGLAIYLCLYLFSQKNLLVTNVLSVMFIVVSLLIAKDEAWTVVVAGHEWSWRQFSMATYKIQLPLIFHDKIWYLPDNQEFPDKFILTEATTGDVVLANPRASIIALYYQRWLDNQETINDLHNKAKQALNSRGYIILRSAKNLKAIIDELNKYSLYLNDIQMIYTNQAQRYLGLVERLMDATNSGELVTDDFHTTLNIKPNRNNVNFIYVCITSNEGGNCDYHVTLSQDNAVVYEENINIGKDQTGKLDMNISEEVSPDTLDVSIMNNRANSSGSQLAIINLH
ncbi:hypothetical protein IJJ08_03270 [bacterium]|nr:hypothetical protein [bacterium]